MSWFRRVTAFLTALIASTLVAVVALEGATALQEGRSPQLFPNDILFIGIFALPFVFMSGVAVGLPIYIYGLRRGWFGTFGRTLTTAAVAGGFSAIAVWLLISSWTSAGLLLFVGIGAITGSVAGAIWWVLVASQLRTHRVV